MLGTLGLIAPRRSSTGASWWLAFAHNDQDRGIARTGRHAGDWELVMVREDAAGRPLEAVYAQHSGAERCPWSEVETRGGQPVVYLANGSHAAYFRPGVRDRTWPDPNDEADGRGTTVVPAVEPLGDWARRPGRWGDARAGWVPSEMDSPRGPAFQPQGRWSDPRRLRRRRPPVHRRPLRRGRRARLARGAAPARGTPPRRPGRHRGAP